MANDDIFVSQQLLKAAEIDLIAVLQSLPALDAIAGSNKSKKLAQAIIADVLNNNYNINNRPKCFEQSSFEYLVNRLDDVPFIEQELNTIIDDLVTDFSALDNGTYVPKSVEDLFDKLMLTERNVSELPFDVKRLKFKPEIELGACTRNAYLAAKDTGCNIVEGYLITYFKDDQPLECVGHVWNELDGVNFDLSIPDNENVKRLQYLAREVYPISKSKTFPVYQHPHNKIILFMTDVKRKERIVRNLLQERFDSDTQLPSNLN